MFDQLSLVWQVWAYMLLGAILMGLGLLVGIEWAWLAFTARAAWTAARRWCRLTFTAAGDDVAPRRTGSITPRRLNADEILITSRGRAFTFRSSDVPEKTVIRFGATPHDDDTLRRRQLLALADTSPFRKTVH